MREGSPGGPPADRLRSDRRWPGVPREPCFRGRSRRGSRRIGFAAPIDLRDELGDQAADRLWMVLLEEMEARAELDEPAIMKRARETFGEIG